MKGGPSGDLSYAVIYNPYYVIKRAHIAKQVHDNKWQALAIRANEIGAFDLEDLDDEGKFIVDDDDDDEAPAASSGAKPKTAAKTTLKPAAGAPIKPGSPIRRFAKPAAK